MNKKIKLMVLGAVVVSGLTGLFGSINTASAQYVVPNCDRATLNGWVDPQGNPTIAWFQWGTSSSNLDHSTPTSTYTSYQSFSYTITGLSPLTTYYYNTYFQNSVRGQWTGSVVSFQTPACSVPDPSVNISAEQNTVPYNGSTNITWTSQNTTSCIGSGGSNGWAGNKNLNGSFYTGPLTTNTTYSISCQNSAGKTDSKSVTVTVTSQPQPTGNLTLSPTSCTIGQGQSTCTVSASWQTQYASNVTLVDGNTNNVLSSVPQSSGQNVWVAYPSTTFFLKNNNTVLDSKTGNASCASGTTWNGTVCAQNAQNNPTVNISANPMTVSYGGSATISWNSLYTSYCIFFGGTGAPTLPQSPSGSFPTGPLTQSTTYAITCYNSTGQSASGSVSVTVTSQPQPTGNLTLSPTSCTIGQGQSTCQIGANWQTQNASNVTLVDGNTGNVLSTVPNSSYLAVWVAYPSTTYYLKNSGTTLDQKTASASCASGTTWNGTVCAQNAQNNPTVNISANPMTVNYGNSSTLNWSSQYASACTASGSWSGDKPLSGWASTGPLYQTSTFTLTCGNPGAPSASNSVTVYVNNNNNTAPSVTTNNASNVGPTSATLNGFVNSNGGNNTIAWFQWGTNANFYNQTNQNNYGSTGGTSYSYYLSGLSPNTTYYFRAVAQNDSGLIAYGNQMSFSTSNTCDYNNNSCGNNQIYVNTYPATGVSDTSATLNGYVSSGSSSSYLSRWFEWGINGYLGNKTNETSQYGGSGNFSQTIFNLAPNTVYRYRAAARDSSGYVAYGNIYSFTTVGSYVNPNDCSTTGTCAPVAITMPASNVGQTNAQLNGTAVMGSAVNVNTTGYFEYGTTLALGLTTRTQTMGNVASVPFFENISGLAQNTTYFYRAVVMNQYGTSRGDIVSFRTGSVIVYTNTVGSNAVYRNTTVVSNTSTTGGTAKPSLVFLSISTGGQLIYKGDTVSYTIYYKNVSSENLSNVLLRVSLPKELEWRSTSLGIYSTENNMVIANIGNLAPQQEGSIQVTALVSDKAVTGKNVVVTADLAYTIERTKEQQEVFAYLENMVGERGASLGAAAIFGTGFLPGTLLGWLLLVLLILLLVAAIRWLYEKSAYGSAAANPPLAPPVSPEH